jgi:hypothetical protein
MREGLNKGAHKRQNLECSQFDVRFKYSQYDDR